MIFSPGDLLIINPIGIYYNATILLSTREPVTATLDRNDIIIYLYTVSTNDNWLYVFSRHGVGQVFSAAWVKL